VTALLGMLSLINPRAAALIVAALVLGLGGYVKGHADAGAACRARELAVELQAARQALALMDAAKIDAENRAVTLEAQAVDLTRKVEDYEGSLARMRRPADGGCRLDAGDVDRLRAIR
jgi:hypothetical protein